MTEATSELDNAGDVELSPEQQQKLEQAASDSIKKMSRKEWREAVVALDVPRAEMDDLDLGVIIAQRLGGKGYEFYNNLGLEDLNKEILESLAD